jgi:hypothetical protein
MIRSEFRNAPDNWSEHLLSERIQAKPVPVTESGPENAERFLLAGPLAGTFLRRSYGGRTTGIFRRWTIAENAINGCF